MSLKPMWISCYRPRGTPADVWGAWLQREDNGVTPEFGQTELHEGYRLLFWLQDQDEYTHGVHLRVRFTDGTEVTRRIEMLPDQPQDFEASTPARRGVMHTVGRMFVDDDGPVLPLGATLFWSLWGWKYDRERLRANLAWLRDHRFDYIRVLGEVGGNAWAGREILPDWPDYQDNLSEFIGAAYREFGLRTQVTYVGGGTGFDPLRLVGLIDEVVRQHEEAVILREAVNEYGRSDKVSSPTLLEMTRRMRTGGQTLVAASTSGAKAGEQGFNEESIRPVMAGGAQVAIAHRDRKYGDDGWRHVRQGYDFAGMPWASSDNEGGGPGSSVHSYSDVLQLVMARAVSAACGAGMFCLHNAAGVMGKVDPKYGRTANLFEMPGIDEIMRAVRGLDALLPPDIPNYTVVNDVGPKGNRPHPLTADRFWEGSKKGTGVNKNYCARSGGRYLTLPCGVRGSTTLTAREAAVVEVYEPVSRELVNAYALDKGQTVTLAGDTPPASRRAYIVRGVLR